MRIRREVPILRKAALLTFLLAVCSLDASAQKFLKLPTIEVFGGYSYLNFKAKTLGFSEQLNMNGWAAAISIPHIYRGLGATVEASGHYATDLTEYNFMAGPQYFVQWRSLRITGHGLFGRAQTRLNKPGSTFFEPSDRHRVWAGGGEVDYSLSPQIWLRVVEADYLGTSAFGDTQHNLRLSTGVVFAFGKH
jgi:hypothetical protein